MTRTTCWPPCAGCIGMGPCDLGEPCAYGCGATTRDGGPCGSCARDILGLDDCCDGTTGTPGIDCDCVWDGIQ